MAMNISKNVMFCRSLCFAKSYIVEGYNLLQNITFFEIFFVINIATEVLSVCITTSASFDYIETLTFSMWLSIHYILYAGM